MLGLINTLFRKNGRRRYQSLSTRLGAIVVAAVVQQLEEKTLLADVTFNAGALKITTDETSAIIGVNSSGIATLNGEPLGVSARNIRSISLTALNENGVLIDLSAASTRAFPRLRSTVLTSGIGDDRIIGSPRNDDVIGGDGNDTFVATSGFDFFDGGGGYDNIEISSLGGNFLANTDAFFISYSMSEFDGIERLSIDASRAKKALKLNTIAFPGDTTVVGSSKSDIINTGSGDDLVDAFEGADTINTGPGDDAILVFGGVINAGTGSDSIDATGSLRPVTVIDSNGSGNDVYFLSPYADKITGSGDTGNDFISGGWGNDLIDYSKSLSDILVFGDEGDDIIKGGSGNDNLQGGDGNDQIFGNDGDDWLFGGFGEMDYLNGGTGDNFLDDPDQTLTSATSSSNRRRRGFFNWLFA